MKNEIFPSNAAAFFWPALIVGFTLILVPNAAFGSIKISKTPLHEEHNLRDLNQYESRIKLLKSELSNKQHASQSDLVSLRNQLLGSLQTLAFIQSVSGEPFKAVNTFNRESVLWNKYHGESSSGNVKRDLHVINSAHAEGAINAIVKAAAKRQVVILNEAHHVEYDRVFAAKLARRLRKIGYEYLACETFAEDDDNILSKGYVTNETGFYSREPMFVNFLTQAIADKWKFVSYEPRKDVGSRDYSMAKNLERKIFSKNPAAKVFIYVGYSHAEKKPRSENDNDGSKLAAQLMRLTGINPLTIDQTLLYDHYDTDQQETYYKHALAKVRGLSPEVLVGDNGKGISLSVNSMAYDFEVVYPRYKIDKNTGRPSWMLLRDNVSAFDIPKSILPGRGKRLIYAYATNSAEDAAPFDVVMVEAGKKAPKLVLPKGNYTLEYEDQP